MQPCPNRLLCIWLACLLATGCGGEPDTDLTEEPPEPVHLPTFGRDSAECYGEGEPQLEQWLRTSSSLLIGRVASVRPVESPIVVSTLHTDGSFDEELRQSVNCGEPIWYTLDVELEEVQTLWGERLDDGVRIRITRQNLQDWAAFVILEQNQLGWYQRDGYPRPAAGKIVPGMHIGGVVARNAEHGTLAFERRMFEVDESIIALQRAGSYCARPNDTPPAIDGMTLAELRTHVDQIPYDPSDEWHGGWSPPLWELPQDRTYLPQCFTPQ